MAKVKICGITNLEDALNAVSAGCDALGFVFYKKSPRYVSPELVEGITRYIPKDILKIGVFVNEKEKVIKDIAKYCSLDILQFHGRETTVFCNKFKGYKIVKAFRVGSRINPKEIFKYKVFGYLFDTYVKNKKGGTGQTFNWQLLGRIDTVTAPIFLSGGLNEKNVREAIKVVKPHWVDASSSLEKSPGKKDHKKVEEFIKKVKSINLKTRENYGNR